MSSIGAKAVMAVTGVLLLLFLVVHMIGNLQVFLGPAVLNEYAEFLHSRPGMVWTARIGLIIVFLVHVLSSLRLKLINYAARPAGYDVYKAPKSTFASRWMLLSGVTILLFVAYHLLHFTTHTTNPEYATMLDGQRMDVYRMVVTGFSNNLIAGTYIAAMILLGFHLWHAIASAFQTLGLTSQRYFGIINGAGALVALVLAIGNIAMPIAVQIGYFNPTTGGS
jgi:succinate dehydrogenase / fumarate reductase cytochrome b subunit